MYWKKFYKTWISCCLAFLIGLFLSTLSTRVIAQPRNLQIQEQALHNQPSEWLALHQQNERRRTLPGRREPAAGRGCGMNMPKPPLMALTPETNLGFTVAAYPQFFFYIPQTSAKGMKFTLLKEDIYKVYEKTFSIPSTSGIFSLSLPNDKTLPPLEVGKNYHWYLQLLCSEIGSGQIYVDGWVQRVQINSTATSRSQKVEVGELMERDREHGFWYDDLAKLAEKWRSNPNDSALQIEWENLLRSEGLDAIARKPLVGNLSSAGRK